MSQAPGMREYTGAERSRWERREAMCATSSKAGGKDCPRPAESNDVTMSPGCWTLVWSIQLKDCFESQNRF